MLTDEQQLVVDTVCSSNDNRIIAVNSIAGSGKTSTGDAIIRAVQPKNGFYTAFNRAIVTNSAARFGNLVKCKTVHALAWQYIRPSSIEEFTPNSIIENISYEDKLTVINVLDGFYRSAFTDIEDYVDIATKDEVIKNLVIKYATMMLEGKIPVTFNYLLKCLHLLLLNKEIEIDFDLFILDEAQDTTAVTLEIFKLINSDRKIIFGDKFQNIYTFMDTVNAFEELDDLNLLRLTKSFRCNPFVAETVEHFGRQYLEDNFQFKGNPDVIQEYGASVAYLSRTNASVIERMYTLMTLGFKFHSVRNIDELFALPLVIDTLMQYRVLTDPRYKFLEKEFYKYLSSNCYGDFTDYLQLNMGSPAIVSACNTVNKFKKLKIDIKYLKERIKACNTDKRLIVTTAHAYKGLEADTVIIENDLNNSVNNAILSYNDAKANFAIDLPREVKEDLNTYYVALSRAKTVLNNVHYI
jgi:superfamily I DNA/RNA helicase